MAIPEISCEQNDWEWIRFKEETNITNGITGYRIGNRRVGVALIGLGRMGMIHLRNLLREPRAHLLYCFDSNQVHLEACAKSMFFKEFGIKALASDDFDVALADPQIEAVLVVTPTCFHEQYTRRALEAGKNVLCEKPLTPDTDKIIPLYELAKEKKVFLLCAFNRRYDPDFRHLHKKTQQRDTLGSLQLVRITARDFQRPPLSYIKVSAGLLHDSAIHDIDMCLWLTRQLPKTVQVMGKTWKEYFENEPSFLAGLSETDLSLLKEIDDFFLVIITMKFPDGSIGVIDNSRQTSYGYDQRCEIYGTKGMLKCDGKHSVNAVEFSENGISNSTMNFGFASRFSTAYMNELRDILTMAELANSDLYYNRFMLREHLLEPDRPMLVVATHRIADACLEASKSGQVVTMNWSEEFKRKFKLDIE